MTANKPRGVLTPRTPPLDAARRLDFIRMIVAHPDIPAAPARLGAAVVAMADGAGLLMMGRAELAVLGGCEIRAVATYLSQLSGQRILQADAARGMDIAIKISLAGDAFADEMDARARRLREARRKPTPRQR